MKLTQPALVLDSFLDDQNVPLEGSTKEMWIRDLFFMPDYVILIEAFYSYNRFYVTVKIER
jgi:hypothetical protein